MNVSLRLNTKTVRNLSFLFVILLLSGCLSVYRVEIQQGNIVTQEMIDKLKPGLTRSQVRYVLGSPLVADPFHQDRWDYYFYLRHSNEPTGESRHLTVIFKNDLLLTVQGDTRVKTDNFPAPVPAVEPSDVKPAPATQTDSQLEFIRSRAL